MHQSINSPAEVLRRISEASNDFYIMSSSSTSQKSYENKAWKNGAFTKALTEAFSNKAVPISKEETIKANTNDNYLTIGELFTFVKKRVTFLANTKNKQQTPHFNRPSSDWGLPIFQYEEN